MEKVSLKVDGMSCAHCEKAVKDALQELGAANVSASAEEKCVDVEFDPGLVSLEAIKKEIAETGYTVV